MMKIDDKMNRFFVLDLERDYKRCGNEYAGNSF